MLTFHPICSDPCLLLLSVVVLNFECFTMVFKMTASILCKNMSVDKLQEIGLFSETKLVPSNKDVKKKEHVEITIIFILQKIGIYPAKI